MVERVSIAEIVLPGRGHRTWGAAWGTPIGQLSLLPSSSVG
jgi:hypothetical protein